MYGKKEHENSSSVPFVLSSLALLLGGCASGKPPAVTGALPLRTVVIYRNGVGYFERAGHVEADQVRFRVRGDEVGDFLATMAVIEKGGSSVRSASFPLKLDPPMPPPPTEPGPGGVPGPEKKPDDQAKLVTVVLELDGKKHDLQVGYVAETPLWRPSYRLVVQRGGKADLQAWGIVQNLSGEDWTRVRLSLVAGAPLAFQATLGTPIIPERPSVTDAGEVVQAVPLSETSLAQASAPSPSPAPEMKNSEPADRDHDSVANTDDVMPEEASSDKPRSNRRPAARTSGAASNRKDDLAKKSAAPRGGGMGPPGTPKPAQMSAAPRGGMAPSAVRAEPAIRANPSGPRDLSALAAVAIEGSSTRYDLPNLVTVPNKNATMVMLLSKRVAGEGIFLFAPAPGVSDSFRHPFRVARFVNQTNGLLERGPIAVFEGGSFLGQGIVEPLPPGATATVPFAIDRAVAVESDVSSNEEGSRIAKIEAGELTIERDLRVKTRYRVRNGNDHVARVLIKHGRRPSTRLFQPPKGTEDNVGTNTALVPMDAAPRGTGELVVDERLMTTRNADWLSDLANEAVTVYLADRRANGETATQLRKAWAIRPALTRLGDEERALQNEQSELAKATEETRQNLRSLEKNPAAAALRTQLTERLARTALRLNEISKRLVEIQLSQNEQRVRFGEALRAIKLTNPLPPPT